MKPNYIFQTTKVDVSERFMSWKRIRVNPREERHDSLETIQAR